MQVIIFLNVFKHLIVLEKNSNVLEFKCFWEELSNSLDHSIILEIGELLYDWILKLFGGFLLRVKFLNLKLKFSVITQFIPQFSEQSTQP